MIDKAYRKALKAFGYLKDSDGIMTRYLQEADNWKSHIQNTRNFILESADKSEKGTCIVLGSGWWLDVPVKELSEIFKKIILVDVNHPIQIKKKAEKFPNVELSEKDITQCVLNLYQNRKHFTKKTETFDFSKYAEANHNFGIDNLNEADLVVSVNILSQLAYFILKFLESKLSLNEEQKKEIKNQIEYQHIKNLPAGKSYLVSDYYEKHYTFKDDLIQEGARVADILQENNIMKKWEWLFDTSGNYIIGRKITFDVAALRL